MSLAGPAATRRAGFVFDRTSVTTRVLAFALVLATSGTAFLLVTPAAAIAPERSWELPFVALALAFCAAEATALHVEFRKESHSLSLSAVPLMFGLLYTSPLLVVLALVCGSLPAMLWIRRSSLLKAAWNSCLFVAQTGVAAFVLRTVLGTELPATPVEWLVPLAAVLAAELLSLLSVSLVIMLADVRFRPTLFADVGRGQILAVLAGTSTIVALSAAVNDPLMLMYAMIPLLGIGVLLKNTGRLSQRFHDLEQVHTFTAALVNEREQRTVDTGLEQLVQIMCARTAGILTYGADLSDPHVSRALVDDTFTGLASDPTGSLLIGQLNGDDVSRFSIDDHRPEVRDLLGSVGATEMLAVRILTEVDRIGALFITDRLGMRSEFTVDEIRVFGSLARTFSARMSNEHLVAELETQAQRDSLTGLANRLNFEAAMASILDEHSSGAVVMIDLDGFKAVNDSLGHETGDRLLVEVARRLEVATAATDVPARFGGDEFAIVLPQPADEDAAQTDRRIEAIHRAITAGVDLDGLELDIGASMGVARWPDHGVDDKVLLHCADTAMYEAKRTTGGVCWYTSELDAEAPRQNELYRTGRTALEDSDMFIELQPKVSTFDGRITGAEALVRWNHPVFGSVAPPEFLPLLARAGAATRLTRFVMEHALEAIGRLGTDGIEVPIAVNLAADDLADPDLVDDLVALLAETGTDARLLHVEISEQTMLTGLETSIAILERLKGLGITVTIDDFGTGRSSLHHLHRLPVDQLKIDRSFVTEMLTNSGAATIVRTSIDLASDLGITTVAEGVEDDATLRSVVALGCDEIQGFVLSHPMSVDDFRGWAHEWDASRFVADIARPLHTVEPSAPGVRRALVGGRTI